MINVPTPQPADDSAGRPWLSLHPLTTARAHQIEHWFDHPEVHVRLGGRFWIHRELRLIDRRPGTSFRGATVLRSYGWIGLDHIRTPVAFIGGDVYDRWVRYHGQGPHGTLLSDEDPRPAMGLGYVVDPDRWRHGYGRAAIQAVLHHPALTDVQIFFAGIDADNHASRRCAEAAGLQFVDAQPDFEGMLYYRCDRTDNLAKADDSICRAQPAGAANEPAAGVGQGDLLLTQRTPRLRVVSDRDGP